MEPIRMDNWLLHEEEEQRTVSRVPWEEGATGVMVEPFVLDDQQAPRQRVCSEHAAVSCHPQLDSV